MTFKIDDVFKKYIENFARKKMSVILIIHFTLK